MNKFQAKIGKELFDLEPKQFENIIEFADREGIFIDWSESDDDDFIDWYRTVLFVKADARITATHNEMERALYDLA